MPAFALTRLTPSAEEGFGELVLMYEEAFPAAERKPTAVLRRMLTDPQFWFLLATADGQPVGFAIVCRFRRSEAAMLEYMAVRPEMRGHGYGRALFAEIAGPVAGPPRVLLMEVESDRVDSPERSARSRRKQFYRSLGARELAGLRWLMPPVIAAVPPPMELLALGPLAATVSKREVRLWLASIYVEVYGQSEQDPRIDEMLADLPDRVPLV